MRRGSWLGAIVCGFGIVYLLDQFHIIILLPVFFTWSVIWPLFLVVIGLQDFRGKARRFPWWAICFILYGLTLSIKHTGLVPALNQVREDGLFWALILVFFGLSLLFPRRLRPFSVPVFHIGRTGKSAHTGDFDADMDGKKTARQGDKNKDSRWHLIGDLSIGAQPWALKDMNMWNGIGDVRVNLATAHVDEGTYHLNIGGGIGDVRVLVPTSLPVSINAGVGLGDLQVFGDCHAGSSRTVHFEDPEFADANRRCTLSVHLRIGDVQIVRV